MRMQEAGCISDMCRHTDLCQISALLCSVQWMVGPQRDVLLTCQMLAAKACCKAPFCCCVVSWAGSVGPQCAHMGAITWPYKLQKLIFARLA